MVTGTGDYVFSTLNQIYEQVQVEGRMGSIPVQKISDDSSVSVQTSESRPVVVTSYDSTYAAFGELLVAEFFPQTAWRFDYGVNTRIINTSGTFNGSISGSFSRAQLFTSTNASGTMQIQTNKFLRYLPGMGGLFRGTAVFATGTANSEQLLGIGDSQDALAFGYDGTVFGVLVRRNGVDTWIAQSSWNGQALSETLIPQNGNIYQIRFQWLGYGLLRFYVFDKGVQRYVNVHTVKYPNTSPLTHILNPTMPILAYIKNKGNTTNLMMYTPSAVAGLEGTPSSDHVNPLDVFNSFDTSLTLTDQNNNHALSLSNATTLNGVRNKVPIQINSIQVAGFGASAVNSTVRLYRNPTTAGARSYTAVDAANSPVSASVTTTTITSANAERSYGVVSNSSGRDITFKEGEFVLSPGEILGIGIQDASNVSTTWIVTINWSELF